MDRALPSKSSVRPGISVRNGPIDQMDVDGGANGAAVNGKRKSRTSAITTYREASSGSDDEDDKPLVRPISRRVLVAFADSVPSPSAPVPPSPGLRHLILILMLLWPRLKPTDAFPLRRKSRPKRPRLQSESLKIRMFPSTRSLPSKRSRLKRPPRRRPSQSERSKLRRPLRGEPSRRKAMTMTFLSRRNGSLQGHRQRQMVCRT